MASHLAHDGCSALQRVLSRHTPWHRSGWHQPCAANSSHPHSMDAAYNTNVACDHRAGTRHISMTRSCTSAHENLDKAAARQCVLKHPERSQPVSYGWHAGWKIGRCQAAAFKSMQFELWPIGDQVESLTALASADCLLRAQPAEQLSNGCSHSNMSSARQQQVHCHLCELGRGCACALAEKPLHRYLISPTDAPARMLLWGSQCPSKALSRTV